MKALRLALPVAAVLIGLPISGCTSDDGSPTTSDSPAGGRPVAGGTVTYALSANLDCLDPHQSPAHASALLSRPILDSLVAQTSEGAIRPWLASSWTVSPDQLTYTFTLKKGVKFTDGTTFDASVVKANLDEIVAPATKSLFAATSISSYQSSTVLSPTKVAVTLSKPNSTFLAAVSTPYLGIESAASLGSGPSTLCTKIVGTGPFASPDGYVVHRGISYTRNASYTSPPSTAAHQGPAYLDGVRVEIVTDQAARQGALTSGQIDLAEAIPPVDVAALKKAPGYSVSIVPTPGVPFSYFPNTQDGVFADLRVRQAFRIGINWNLIVSKLYYGVYKTATGPLDSTSVGYDASVAPDYAYDVSKAGALLDQAGWTARDPQGYRTKDGKRLSAVRMFVPGKDDPVLTTQIQAAAKSLGIEIKDDPVDIGTYVKRDIAGDYDLGDTFFASATPDVLRVLFSSASISSASKGLSNNVARYSNPTVDQDVDHALRTTSVSEQKSLYAAVQKQVTADAALFPIYETAAVLGTSNKIHGLTFETSSFPTFYDAWKS